MEKKSVDLQLNLDAVTQNFSDLREQLFKANKELQESLIPPSVKLAEQIVTCRSQFEELRSKVLQLAKSLEVTTPSLDQIVSVENIETLLQVVAEAEKAVGDEVRQRALEILDRILLIRYSDNIDFSPLQECQAQARELHRAILNLQDTDLCPEAEALTSAEHPLAKLLTLISDRESPDYQRLEKLQAAVAQSFGMPVALAALTGKLIFLSESVPVETEGDDTKDVTFSVEKIESEITSNVEQFPLEIDSSEITKVETFSSANHPNPKAVDEFVTEAPTTLPIKREPDAPAKEQANAQEIAISILNSNVEESQTNIKDLIWELIYEDKVSLAFHLARSFEIRFPDIQPRLPSWLIRAVILGCNVRYEVGAGEIANILMDDFANFSESLFAHRENEWNQASTLLLAASALRPALLAPNTNASDILNHLRLGEGLNQLFGYCRLIANYGSQRCALNTTAIKTVRSQEEWETDIAALRQEVEDWWSQAPLLDMIYGMARAVWRKWLEPNNLIYSLLIPVKENDLTQLEVAKKYVDRLSSESQINAEVKRTQKEINGLVGGKAITGTALGRIRLRVREAVDFGRRWIELQESRPDKENDFSQRQAKQIK